MIRYLLDVNVLIALIDPAHVQHDQVHEWFGRAGRKAFATCPITENGLLRIVGHPKYPNSPGPPSTVAAALAAIRGLDGTSSGPTASASSTATSRTRRCCPATAASPTATSWRSRAHKGQLATLDQKLATEVVADGKSALCLI